jgi:hypothetical protein
VSIVVQEPPLEGRRSKVASTTPEPASAESEETVTEEPETMAAFAGALSDPVGTVASNVNVRLDADSAFPALSVALTCTVYSSSAGKLAAPKAYDQSPAKSEVVKNCSEPDEKALPFQ